MSENPIVWWELASHDARTSVMFLEKLFGWRATYDERTAIYDVPVEDGAAALKGGGVFTLRKAKLPFLTLYVEVTDIDEKARRVTELGGHIVEAPFDVPDGPRICLFNEPSGVTLAMLERRPAP